MTRTTSRTGRALAAALLGGCSLLATVLPAAAATDDAATDGEGQPAVRVEHVELAPDGTSELVVSVTGVTGDLTGEELRLFENGQLVEGVTISRPDGETVSTPAVVVAIDTSGSTEGEPLAQAVAASAALAERLEANGVVTGLVTFAQDVTVLSRFDDPAGTLAARLGELVADGETSLYDAVARGTRLLAEHDGPRDLVVFSDGVDTVSATDLTAARQLAVDSEVRVTAVALASEELDLAPMEAIATATGGQLITVTDPQQLVAVFADVAADLTSRYVLRWQAPAVPVPPTELALAVEVTAASGVVRQELVALSQRTPAITPAEPWEPADVPVPLLGNQLGLVIGAAAAFLSVLLLAGLVLGGAGERARRERLASRLEAWDGTGPVDEEAVVAAASLTKRAADVVDRLPTPKGLEERLSQMLERADWPMRPSELELVIVGSALAGLVLPLLVGVPALAIVLLPAAGAAPIVVLRLSISRRIHRFEEQLPQVLMLLAGALRAGHALSTALDGAIQESAEPARSELRRAAIEARLGRPVPDALRGVALRLRSDELHWVVNAMAVQQEVGGNLAELLDNVSSTLRERASLGRHVSALAAEGRMSAWIIGVMPVVMFAFMTAFNPDYVSFFITDPRGVVLLAIGVILLALGGVMLKRIVTPRF